MNDFIAQLLIVKTSSLINKCLLISFSGLLYHSIYFIINRPLSYATVLLAEQEQSKFVFQRFTCYNIAVAAINM
jgi:hypothetical protein